MGDQADKQRDRPDGSAYATHLAGVAERNLAAKKAGRARRADDDLRKAKNRRDADRRSDAGLKVNG